MSDEENQLTWTIAWIQSGTTQWISSTVTADVQDELNLQLGWLDLPNQGDLFDAWLADSSGNRRLAQGNLVADIDVHAVGFHSGGLNSTIHSFTAAVPEPTSIPLALLGVITVFLGQRRRTNRTRAHV